METGGLGKDTTGLGKQTRNERMRPPTDVLKDDCVACYTTRVFDSLVELNLIPNQNVFII
ncbi:hypothetical protein F441_07439 [Phytophthora nicotianae CJ01A1]|uniref:Uncharacterized protein n=3 Tax=Phytophthora nicotianae TaxID=4792 RepID=W2JRY4_PHYNI|nr:hypothetical protein L915_07282 [Phytophthora nicotianae]ETL49096.1 hypothetical protein L916_01360 [Phytophthora nicotianae]ETM48249.1 hypothetical protein L914_07178 [Phytophthora nicotianae]ETO58524.1 hypothetical protein F444_23097 [Phytophthora nicotianae P1976]ETP18309.1 hypothetical protein F441_07439 [Phytophthora nicotianae CJ01A1]